MAGTEIIRPQYRRFEGGHRWVLPWADRVFQYSAVSALRRRVSDDGDREGAEIRDAGDDEEGARVGCCARAVTREAERSASGPGLPRRRLPGTQYSQLRSGRVSLQRDLREHARHEAVLVGA